MANQAPGVNINVSASASNPRGVVPTGTWFVLGVAAGPAGIAVPINSMADFNKYFGSIVNGSVSGRYTLNSHVDSTLLYDALDVFFREGGVNAYVSRVQPTSTGVAATSATNGGKFLLTAKGKGTWANSSNSGASGVTLQIDGLTISGSTQYRAIIRYNGNVLSSITGLTSDTDVINWVNSLPAYQSMVTASAISGTTVLPATGDSVVVYLTGGTDISVADADVDAALAVFDGTFGPGQVSYPGNTGTVVAVKLSDHATASNRVAVLDAPNTATTATLTAAVASLQAGSMDSSYASMFAPWLIVPGLVSTNPNAASGATFSRTVAPSALAAAKMAANDQSNDANVPAAGVARGASSYAINVTQSYSAADLGDLNNAGVNILRNVPNVNVIAIYGFRSCALDQNWAFLNNVRFRMQVTRDFDFIAESFVFQQIDGKGHIFATLNGALGGQCAAYWTRKSIYGATASDAFTVNTGTLINTPATIAAGQINAEVNLRMSPFGEFVTVNVTKYAVTAALPTI
jgi:hypothetical protein